MERHCRNLEGKPDYDQPRTHQEERVILGEAKASLGTYFPFILCLFRTGCREGEAVALRAEDFDFQSRYIVIQRNFTAGRLRG